MSLHSMRLVVCVVFLLVSTVSAFVPARPSTLQATSSSSWRLYSSGKGFGASPPKKKKYNEESDRTVERTDAPQEQNMGQKALQELRRERAEQRDEELRKVREMTSVDNLLKEQPDAAVIPEKVAMRMGKRMLPFVGLPLFGGMGAFVAFWYLATYKNMEFQPSLVAFTTIGILVVGLLGITYSVMSASWDEETEGSVLGVEEFTSNLDNLKGGLSRSRENALLREKMAGMSEDEIQAALRDLEKREAPPSATIASELQNLQNEEK